MSTSTASSIATTVVTSLEGYISQLFTTLAPWAISIAILFVGIALLKNLWHRRV